MSAFKNNKVNVALGIGVVLFFLQINFQRGYLHSAKDESESPVTQQVYISSSGSTFDESNKNNKVYISRSPLAPSSCISIALSSNIDYERLFYLDFVSSEVDVMREWMGNGCHDKFFDVFVAKGGLDVKADRGRLPRGEGKGVEKVDFEDGGGGSGSDSKDSSSDNKIVTPPDPPPPPAADDDFDANSLPVNHVKSEVIDFNSQVASAVVFRPTFSKNPDENNGLYWSDELIDIHQLHDTKRNNEMDEADIPNTLVKIADLQKDEQVREERKRRAVRTPAGATTRHIRIARFAIGRSYAIFV